MERTVRDELMMLTLIFCFCLLSIPLMMIKDNLIGILETINYGKMENDSLMQLKDLIEISEREFNERFSWVSPDFQDQKSLGSAWEEFDFVNGTVLTSNSMMLPLIVDWRDKKVISDVQNQGSCGSCFALAVIEAIESMNALKTLKLTSLSVQQMLDCNVARMNCDGGDPSRLLKWLYNALIPIQTKDDYPSLAQLHQKQNCEYEKLKEPGVIVKDYSDNDFSQQEELILLYLAYQGPLVASINAMSLKSYKNEIVEDDCDSEFKKLNHVVQIVGYDLSGDVPYYIVKNSWGLKFGEAGYMRIAIGNNVCGIAQRISAVVV